MNLINLIFIFLLMLSGFLAIYFVWISIRSHKTFPGGIDVALIGFSIAIWTLSYLVEIFVSDLPTKMFLFNLKQIGNTLLPAAFLVFALQYGHYVQKIKKYIIVLLCIEPVIVNLLFWMDQHFGIMILNNRIIQVGQLSLFEFDFGIGMYLHFGYSALLTISGAVLLIVRYFKTKSYFRHQTGFILLGMVIPFIGAFFSIFGIIPSYYDVTPLLLGFSFPLMAVGLFQNQFFKLVPIDNQSILDHIPYGLIVLNTKPDQQISALNPKALEILKTTPEKAIGKPVTQFISDWQFNSVEKDTPVTFGLNWSSRSYNVQCYPVKNSKNTVTSWLILFHDQTEERRLEETLKTSETKYRTLVERSTDGIAIFQNQQIRYCNPQLSKILGFPSDQLIGQSIETLITNDSQSLNKEREAFLINTEVFDSFYEFTLVHHNGTPVPVEISIAKIPFEESDALLFIIRDITQRKIQQAEQEKSVALLQATIEHANAGILVIDAQQNVLAHNRKLLDLWKMPADWARLPSKEERADHFFQHAYDFKEAKESANYLLSNLDVENQRQLQLKDGRVIDRFTCPFRIRGELVGRLYIYQDVTESIQNQLKLMASEEKYRLIAENASDVIWTTDFEEHFTYVSPSVEKLRGYSVEEVLKQSLKEALTPESYQIALKAFGQIKESLQEKLPVELLAYSTRNRFELEQPCKDGSTIWTEVEASLLIGKDKSIIGIQGVSRDITERRRNELALEEARNLAEERTIEAQDALLREKQLHSITRTISSSMEIDTILSDLLHQTLEITDGDEAQLGLISEDGLTIDFQFGMDRESSFLMDESVKRDLSYLSWQIVDQRKGILKSQKEMQDAKNIFKKEVKKLGATSFLGVPIMAGLSVLGVLGIFSKKPDNIFTEHDLTMMESIGSQAGIALQNARLFSEVNLLAVTDPLTRLYNRRYFFNLARVELERARRYDHELSIIIMDIDYFKRVNDSFGHLAGDEVLISMTECMRETLRQFDLAARYGGEEFVILLPETELESAAVTAERLRSAIDEMRVPFNGDKISITVSVGVSSYMNQTEIDVSKLLDQADQALYAAKAKGRNRVVTWPEI